MSEKKTFKNPQVAHIYMPYDGDEMFERTTDDAYIMAEDGGGHGFDRREWDVEVTFTKKVKPPKVGDKALSPSGLSEVEIAAIDGDEVWLRYSDGSHSTIDLDKLIYAS